MDSSYDDDDDDMIDYNVNRPLLRSSSSSELSIRYVSPLGVFHPQRPLFRYIGLLMMCGCSFFVAFSFDTPSALQDIIKKTLGVNTFQYSELYTFYAWPNIIMTFVGGYLIDCVFGVRIGTVVFVTVAFIGQSIVAIGAYIGLIWVMYLGRLIFGIGMESLIIATGVYAFEWFHHKELNMAYGLLTSSVRLSIFLNINIVRRIYDYLPTKILPRKLGETLFGGSVAGILAIVCAIILYFLDKRRCNYINKRPRNNDEEERKKWSIFAIRKLPKIFWCLTIMSGIFYSSLLSFVALGLIFFTSKYNLTPNEANVANSLIYLIASFTSPMFGLIIDRTGKNVSWITVALILAIITHILFAFTFLQCHIGTVILGIGYSIIASTLWAVTAFIVPKELMGISFGALQSTQNVLVVIFSLIFSWIVDTKGYFLLEIFYVFNLFMCICLVIIMRIMNRSNHYLINSSKTERKLMMSY
ncbi:hypothetical protein SNEBB_001147 [Seison nebaliae]|nr:hypothetical protein SNEBB_001147 [Seison nebaliae]